MWGDKRPPPIFPADLTYMMAAKRHRASPATVSVPEFWSASPTRTVPPTQRRRPANLTHVNLSRP